MNKLFWTLTLSLMLIAAALPAHAAPLAINLERFEIDDIELFENQVNRLSVQRNNEYQVEVKFSPTQDLKNVQVEIFASGFEFSDVSPIGATSRTFDADANVTYVRRFNVKLSDQVDEDDYKFRVLFTDRNNNELVKNFNVKFDIPRHTLKVEDVVFYPDGAVQAGNALLTTVRIENQGEREERDVRVEVSIPTLGVSGVDYIDEIKNGGNREKGTEEIFMRIPDCAKPGTYEVVIKAWYNQLHDVVAAKGKIDVLENPVCKEREEAAKKPATDAVLVVKATTPPATGAVVADTKTTDASATDASKTSGNLDKVRSALESILLVLIALLVVVAAIIAFRGLDKHDE